ncbi:LIM domain protein, partial [Necator americanus]
RKTLRSLSPPAPVGVLERSPELDDSTQFGSTEHHNRDDWRCVYPPQQRSQSSYELRHRDDVTPRRDHTDYDRNTHVREELEFDEMYRKKNYHTVGSYRDRAPKTTVVPVHRIDRIDRRDYRSVDTPRPYHPSRSRSTDFVIEREYREDEDRISDVTHRFYDRDGNYLFNGRRRGCDIDIRRDYNLPRDAERRSLRVPTRKSKSMERCVEERLEYEEKEKRIWIPERRVVESRDWRDVINQQRQAAPGRAADTQRIRDASASLGNLPAIINRKLEETRKFEKERQTTEYGYRTPHIDSYEREYGRFEKSYQPDYRSRTFDSSRYGGQTTTTRGVESDFATSDYRRREHREINPSTVYDRREMSYREDIRREPVNNDQVVAVSGKHRCAHCADELGRGAAMIIESLNLFYHLACFKCYVCKTPLGKLAFVDVNYAYYLSPLSLAMFPIGID